MSVAYKDVLERFVKYREQRNISQNELAQMLRISQSYVSKMEVGKARISFEILTALYQQGWDIDYIITGQENHRTVLNDLYDSCNKERRADFCSIWFGQCVRASKVMKNISNRWSGILRNLNISICIHLELRQKILHFTESGR